MGASTQLLLGAPRVLLVGGLVSGALALIVWSWLMRRLLGRLLGRPGAQPVGVLRALFVLVFAMGCAGVAAMSFFLCVTMAGYQAFTHRTRIAEIQAVELGHQKLRVYLVPLDGEGHRGPTETYDVDGDEWTVGGEILRFRPYLTALGVLPAHALTRVEGRWRRAADANAHKGTAYDRAAGGGIAWRFLEESGHRGPLGWAIAGVHGQAISQLPDRLAVYDVFVTPNGYVVDKRGM